MNKIKSGSRGVGLVPLDLSCDYLHDSCSNNTFVIIFIYVCISGENVYNRVKALSCVWQSHPAFYLGGCMLEWVIVPT